MLKTRHGKVKLNPSQSLQTAIPFSSRRSFAPCKPVLMLLPPSLKPSPFPTAIHGQMRNAFTELAEGETGTESSAAASYIPLLVSNATLALLIALFPKEVKTVSWLELILLPFALIHQSTLGKILVMVCFGG